MANEQKIAMLEALARIDIGRQQANVNQHIQVMDAKVANEQKLLEAAKGKSSEEIFNLALLQNPSLGNAYALAQQAKAQGANYERQLEVQNAFRGQLEVAYGQNNQLATGLMSQALTQWGTVQSARAAATRAQVVPTGANQQLVEVHQAPPVADRADGPLITPPPAPPAPPAAPTADADAEVD